MTGPSSTPRPRVDQLADDMLDALHAQLEASEAATAMFKARAEQAEAELAVSREVARSNRRHVQAIVPELEKAEAAIERVRDWATQTQHGAAASEVLAALDGTA